MKDWQLGYRPDIDDPLLGNAYSDNEVTDFGLGAPQRVLDEWEKRHTDRINAERARTQLLRERKVNTRCMTDGDTAGIMPKAKPLTAAKLQALMEKFFLAHVKPAKPEYVIRGQGSLLAYQPVTDTWRKVQEQQQAQNEYTDSLIGKA